MAEEFTYIKLPNAKNHDLWKYFNFKSKDGKTIWNEGKPEPTAYCVIENCKHPSVTYFGNTTNITRHLATYHPKENAEYLGGSTAPPPGTSPLVPFLSRKPLALNDPRAKTITQLIINLIVNDLRPVNIVDGVAFRELIAHAYPEYPLASRSFYTDRINDRYAIESTKLIELLKSVDSVAITTDLWTSMAHHAYLGITVHFVNKDGLLQWRLLDCVEMPADHHTAEDIAELLSERIPFWGLSGKVFAGVSDNGQNMQKAIHDILKLPVSFGCFAHTVNLAVEKGFKSGTVSPLLARARHVIEHFTRSSKATYNLRNVQMQSGRSTTEVLELVRDVQTRWTSVHAMITRLLELKDAVHAVLSNSDKRNVRDLDLSAETLYQLRELNDVLKPLCLAMQGMGGQDYVSVSVLAPLLNKLVTKELAPSEADTPVVFDFKKAALDDLRGRYDMPGQMETFAICTFLDPQFKDFRFVKDPEERVQRKQMAIDGLKNESTNETSNATDVDNEEVTPPPAKKFAGDAMLRDYLNDDSSDDDTDSADRPTITLQMDLDRYAAAKMQPTGGSPIDFWRLAKTEYPLLSALAFKYLAIPATSVPSERLFSTAGLVINKLRASTTPELVSKILFLNKNVNE